MSGRFQNPGTRFVMTNLAEQPCDVSPESVPAGRYNVERSCLRCHERKVRCNREVPCSTCLKAKGACRYPDSSRTKRRPKRPTVIPRLEVLERAVAAISQTDRLEIRSEPLSGTSLTPETCKNPLSISANPQVVTDGGVLLKEGTSTRYINEVLFSRVLDKVCVCVFARSVPVCRLLFKNTN